VRIPVRFEGETEKTEATVHYSIGAFWGRDTPLALGAGEHSILRFRIPLELFRARERFAVEVLARRAPGAEKVVWAKRWTVVWQGKAPSLEPLAE